MIGEVLKVLRNHRQRALKHGVEDLRNFIGHRSLHLIDDCREERQHLGVARVRNVPRIVTQDGIVHLRHELLRDEMRVVAAFDKCFDESKNFSFDRAQQLDKGRLTCVRPAFRDALTDQFAVKLVNVQNIRVNG